MSITKIVVTFIIIIVSLFRTASSLKCYQCSSADDLECGEIFDIENTKLQPTECEVYDAQYCIKTTGLYEGIFQTKRNCTSRKFEDYCSYTERVGDLKPLRSCVWICRGDACNSSTKSIPAHFIAYLCLLLITSSLFARL